ncbi:MAG: FAD binding domain-containing protein [Pseudomonadota bacterium]
MAYLAPRTISDALQALSLGGARAIAGGTDFYPALGERPVDFDIVDLTRIAALKNLSATADGGWRIGAAVTWNDIATANLPPLFDGLKAAAREVGAIQIQNTGTIAGNLCNASPAADGVPSLMALGAQVELASKGGVRRLALDRFITGPRQTALGPGEIVTAVLLPPHPADAGSAFLKLGARRYLVISIAMVGVVVAVDGAGMITLARVSVGACSPVARRLPALEAALVGRPAESASARVAEDHFMALSPIGDVRASAEYRSGAVVELTRRALGDAVEAASAATGEGEARA